MKAKNILAAIVLSFIVPLCARSQYTALGSWNILNIKYSLNEKWSVRAEGQLHSLHFYDHFHYFDYQAGVSRKLGKNLNLTIGIGDYNTYMDGGNFVHPMKNNEFRTSVQLAMSQNFGRVMIEHRYRAEQRFTSKGFRNRFRYRINAKIPFGKTGAAEKFYAIANNELFFTNNEPYFERNRLFYGAGYKINNNLTVQAGHLYQFDYKINDETGRGFFQLAIMVDLKKKKNPNNIPD